MSASSAPAPTNRTARRSASRRLARGLAPLGLCAALAVGTVACSSDDSADGDTTTTAAKSTDDSATSDKSDSSEKSDSDESDSGSSASGDAAAVKIADGEAAADHTVTFTAADAFDPSTLSVGVGELITFKAAADAGTHAVRFGDSTETYTITGGLVESFTIDAPGTYEVTEDLTNATMTITVS